MNKEEIKENVATDRNYIPKVAEVIPYDEIPFERVSINKIAYSLSDFPVERWRDEIEKYVNSENKFLSKGLGPLEFKTFNKETKDAIGQMVYKNGKTEFTLPIVVDSGELKDVDIIISEGKFYPLDENFIFNELYKKEGDGEIIQRTYNMDDNYDTLHHGMFEARSGVFTSKIASEVSRNSKSYTLPKDTLDAIEKIANAEEKVCIIDIKEKEDQYNPYHYNVSLMKKAGETMIFDHLYMNSSEVESIKSDISKTALFDTSAETNKNSYIGEDERLKDIPIVKGVSTPGFYNTIPVKKGYDSGYIMKTHSIFEDGSGLLFISDYKEREDSRQEYDNEEDSSPNRLYEPNKNSFIYGKEIVASSKSDDNDFFPYSLNSTVNQVMSYDFEGKNIVFSKKTSDHKGWVSNPYKVIGDNLLFVGDKVESAKILRIQSYENNKTCLVWINTDIKEISKANRDKIKELGLYNLIANNDDLYIIPAEYGIVIIGERVNQKDSLSMYGEIIDEISKDYDSKLTVERCENDNYNINITDKKNNRKEYTKLSNEDALMLSNYYLGTSYDNIDKVKTASYYMISGDIDFSKKKTISENFNSYRGEFMKAASFFYKYMPFYKEAEITDAVNSLIGVEYIDSIDSENLSDVKNELMRCLNKVGNILMMSRLGKLKINENVSKKAMSALTSLINNLTGKNKYNA